VWTLKRFGGRTYTSGPACWVYSVTKLKYIIGLANKIKKVHPEMKKESLKDTPRS